MYPDLLPNDFGSTWASTGTVGTDTTDQRQGAYDYLSGALQTGLALGTSYLSRRIDIDLQTRLTQAGQGAAAGAAVRRSNQPLVTDHADVTTRAVATATGMRVGDLLPWLGVALVGYLVLRGR